MECLRSFNFVASGQSNWSGTDVKTWFVGAQEFWTFERAGSSTFTPQGFKNIDVYGIDLIGNFSTIVGAPAGGAIPTDWNVSLNINGTLPLLGGVIAPTNFWNITDSSPSANNFQLGRFSNKAVFASPIKSVTSFEITGIKANGSGGQTAGNLNISYFMNFIVYYKFEGE
jgi:hypothetical protein